MKWIIYYIIKEIKFDFNILDTNDNKKKLPFDFIFDGYEFEQKWNNYNDEDYLFKNEEFIKLIKKYVEMYYIIKTLDLNMDYIKIKIKELYPEFHRIDCDYTYTIDNQTEDN